MSTMVEAVVVPSIANACRKPSFNLKKKTSGTTLAPGLQLQVKESAPPRGRGWVVLSKNALRLYDPPATEVVLTLSLSTQRSDFKRRLHE